MLITSLELQNVKSYGPQSMEIPFKPGVNLICGRNGSGKSTILESIGFALFDSLDYKHAQLCREGENSCQIVLSFKSALDERSYQVIRAVGKSSSLRIYDPMTKSWLVRARKDSEEWLSEHLGLEMSYAKELFSNAVGVSQGKMTASFLESERIRKPLFNPLLRVEEYETAWTKLRETKSYLADQLAEANQAVARLEGRLERLPQVEEQIEKWQAQLLAYRAALGQAEKKLGVLQEEVRLLEEEEAVLARLTQQVAESKRELSILAQQMDVASLELKKALDAANVVAQSSDGYAAYQEAQRLRDELEERRQVSVSHANALQATKKELAIVVTRLTHLEKELEGVANAEAKVLELVPEVALQVELEAVLQEAQKDVQLRQQALNRAKEEVERLAKLAQSLQKIREELKKRTEIEADLSAMAANEAELSRQRHELDSQLSLRREEYKEIDRQLRRAEQEKRDWENDQERLRSEEETLKGYQSTLRNVEAQLEERTAIEQALQGIEQGIRTDSQKESAAKALQEQAQQLLQNLDERLVVLRQSETANCPVCKRELSEHLAHELQEEFERERMNLQSQQKEAQKNLEAAAKARRSLKREQNNLQKALYKLPTASRAVEWRQSIEKQEAKTHEWQARVAAREGVADEVMRLQSTLQALDKQLTGLNEQYAGYSQEHKRLNQVRDKLNRQLSKLSTPQRAEELVYDTKEAEAQKEQFENEAEALANAPLRLKECRARLAELGDPRTKQAKELAFAEQRPNLERQQQEFQKQQAQFLLKQQAQEATLALFATLEGEIESNKALQAANQNAYNLYLAHQKLAQSLPSRQQRLSSLQLAHSAQARQELELVEKQRQAQLRYNAHRHQYIKKTLLQINNQIITLRTQLKAAQSQLKDAQLEQARLQEEQKALKAAYASVTRWTQLSDAFRFVRDGIRQAGPAVVQRRVRLISHHADQLFQDIVEEPSYVLNWDESYAITLRCRGEERDFQQLSGGEQMAAAIAIRLALLIQMSQVRILFLDEPTTHLDERRRDKLADRITKLEGLQQIFVITHDDSFERETHHVLRVQKESGMSVVK